jgi:glycogen(starch) synthase
MKILHFIYDHVQNPWVGGGGAVRAFEICRRLSNKHNVTLVCGRYPGAYDYREGNLNVKFAGTFKNNYILSTFSYASQAAKVIREEGSQFDVLIEDFAPYNPLFSFLWRKDAIIQIHHREGCNLVKRYAIFGIPSLILEEIYPKFFRNIICVSESSKKKFGISDAVVIPNGVGELMDVSYADEGHVSFVGRIHIHNKGLDTLIRAIGKTGVKLIIGGKGRDEKKMLDIVKKSGLENKVEFRGFLADGEKRELLSHSMMLVLPSRYEGQGIVVLEAAACGKPVVVSDISELSYAVDAGFGLSFKTGDSNDLAEKIRFLLNNEAARREMGKKAIEYAGNFTWDQIADKYERYLLNVIGSSARKDE